MYSWVMCFWLSDICNLVGVNEERIKRKKDRKYMRNVFILYLLYLLVVSWKNGVIFFLLGRRSGKRNWR